MNHKTLHITNGDSTTRYLQSLDFKGEFITWREMLCEGRTLHEVGSEDFWKTRFDFLKKSYKVTKKTFIDFTLKEYRLLCQKKHQEQIVLWFEHDLFCQINMIAVISWLKQYRPGVPVYLVCSGDVKGVSKRLGLAELNKTQLKQHYKNKVLLSQDDIEYADYIWQLYCSDSPLRLETVHSFNPMSPFKYLSEALQAHLKRFPTLSNGLNEIENTILSTAAAQQPKNKHQFVGMLLKNQGVHGFGDLQYFTRLDEMKRLFTSFDPVKLSRKGKQVLHKQLNFYREIRTDQAYLGGARKYSFLYVENSHKLLQITS